MIGSLGEMSKAAGEAEEVMTSVQDSDEVHGCLYGAGDPTTGSSILPLAGLMLCFCSQVCFHVYQ